MFEEDGSFCAPVLDFLLMFVYCRYYYRCTYKDNMNCPATKQVQQKDHSDPPLYAVTYYNEHSCNSAFLPLSPSEFQLQTSSGKAVSICFDSSSGPAGQEPPSVGAAAAAATNASGGSPSSSAVPRRCRPDLGSHQLLLQRRPFSPPPSTVEAEACQLVRLVGVCRRTPPLSPWTATAGARFGARCPP